MNCSLSISSIDISFNAKFMLFLWTNWFERLLAVEDVVLLFLPAILLLSPFTVAENDFPCSTSPFRFLVDTFFLEAAIFASAAAFAFRRLDEGPQELARRRFS